MGEDGLRITRERVIKNEQAFEAYNNRRIEFEKQGVDPDRDPVPIVCECGNADCIIALQITPAEYEDIHRHPQRFVVRGGHVIPEAERVVDRRDRFWVVEKLPP
jgi:hypothetical protein